MNRALNWFNFLGVFALAALCLAQWINQHAAEIHVSDLESIRLHQADEIENQKTQLQQNGADLSEFRRRNEAAEKSLAEKSEKLAVANLALTQTRAERDDLKASLAKWQAAVAQRDAAIESMNSQVQKATEDRDAAIVKYNDLITQSNTKTASK